MDTRSRMELLGCGKFIPDNRNVSEGARGVAEGGGGGGLAAFGDGSGSGGCGV